MNPYINQRFVTSQVPPSPRHFDSFQNPPSAELSIDDTLSSLRSELDQFKLRVSANQNEIGELQEENNDRSKEYQAVVGKIRARLLLLSDRLSSSVDAQRVFENMLRELQADIAVMNYTVSSSMQDVFQYFDYGTEVSEDDYEGNNFYVWSIFDSWYRFFPSKKILEPIERFPPVAGTRIKHLQPNWLLAEEKQVLTPKCFF